MSTDVAGYRLNYPIHQRTILFNKIYSLNMTIALSAMFENKNWFNFNQSFYIVVITVYDETKVNQIVIYDIIPLALLFFLN